MYLSGLIGIVTLGAGIAVLYVKVPQDVVHLDIKQPNTLLKIISIILIVGGAFNLIGTIYSGIRHEYRESREIARQNEGMRQNEPQTQQTPSSQPK
jgi:hypothetical protein